PIGAATSAASRRPSAGVDLGRPVLHPTLPDMRMLPLARPLALPLAVAAFVGATPTASAAQGKKPQTGVIEASASLFQGNADQRAIFTRGELGHADSTWQLRGSLSFGYADAARDSLPRNV